VKETTSNGQNMQKILEKMEKKQSITVSGTKINLETINKV
jgi:hypothetical protein